MRPWLALLWLAGCAVRNDARYCDSTHPCADPAFPVCDPVAHECEASGVPPDLAVPSEDLSSPDLAVSRDFTVLADLTTLDLTALPDLTPLPDLMPQCVSSTSCADPTTPICDSVTQSCRACNSSGDNSACALHGAGLRCKTSGTNAGHCAQCNVSADCSPATPVCNPDGTCRKCIAHSECTSGVCDLRAGAGTCADGGDILYVNNENAGCASGNGSSGMPYCQMSDAVANLGAHHFVHVAATATHYNGLFLGPSPVPSPYFVGGAFGAQPIVDATIVDGTSKHCLEFVASTGISISATFDGFQMNGDSSGTNVYCDSSGGSTAVTLKSCNLIGGYRSVRIINCTGNLGESMFSSATDTGVSLEGGSTWDLHNSFVFQEAGVGVSAATVGSFNFNTVAFNGGIATGSTTDFAGGVNCGAAVTLNSSIVFNNQQNPHTGGTQFAGTCTLNNVVTGTDTIGPTGKLAGTPVFRSATAPYDLHLKVDNPTDTATNRSCCIDKVPAGGFSIDIDQDARPLGPSADVGGDEAL
jgi:hypothetical protein